MAELFHFSTQSTLTADENLSEFIRMCRNDLTLFGSDLNWESWSWPSVNFTKLGTQSRGCTVDDALDCSFIDFSKAYFRYQQSHKPTGTKNESKALRAIEFALLQAKGSAAISGLDIATLDEAALIGRKHYSAMAAYQCGRELQRLARFVTTKRLIDTDLGTWKHPIKKPQDVTIQTGPKAKAIHDKKMPSQEALDAMAEIFATNPKNPKDIFTSCTFALTMCAPVRISEILELPQDCEVEELDSDGNICYRWRFFSGKGYGGDMKDIPAVMAPIAKEALRRIRALTEDARKLALWIENNPELFYRHTNCPTVTENEPLSAEQAAQALGLTSINSTGLSAAYGANTLSSLSKYVKSRQPIGLPWLSKKKGVRYSNALFCMTRNILHDQRGVSPAILWAPDVNVFNNDLSPRESLGTDSHANIFDRYGYKTIDGKPLKLTSHQARHLLNTIANRGGLSQDQIAKWSGRADQKQNRVYNNMSEFEMVAKAEELDTSLSLFGPSGEVAQNAPITTQEFNLTERGAVHITEFGACVHDYTMSPCEKFRDCLNCQEQVCVKGDCVRQDRIKARLDEVEKDYAAAKDAIAQGFSGADRWFEHQEKTVIRLRQLVEILDNPDVPDGSQIKLRDGKDYSHLLRVIRLKAVDALEWQTTDQGFLPEMTRLLDGNLG